MRHGDASFNAPTDAERQLSHWGHDQVQRQLLERGAIFSDVTTAYISPFKRAKQTFAIIAQSMPSIASGADCEFIVPEASVTRFQDWAQQWSNVAHQSVLIVTHNPFVSNLVNHLCGFDHGRVVMSTASIVELEGDVVAGRCMTLKQQFHV